MAPEKKDIQSQALPSLPAQESSSSSWFKRRKKGISTTTAEKKEVPDGLWTMCPSCKYTCTTLELKENLSVCPKCNHHHRIGSAEYFEFLFDDSMYTELFAEVTSIDFLGFSDLKPYSKRLEEAYEKTGLHDSITSAVGKVGGNDLIVACMDFNFIGGSLGSVMGEKIARSAEYALSHRIPLMIISKSGGARMMESAFSLMQLPKTLGKISRLAQHKIPYISLCTDPTYGGTTASFAMVGDINIGEPGAMIGFAGPRVIKETIKKDLPEGFQTSEFVMEHGFLDMIVERKHLKDRIAVLLDHFKG
ncbi:MAG: acetyl-CoA carboxylase, carboxyltransferase subunit beta [Bacteroidota bacterium]